MLAPTKAHPLPEENATLIFFIMHLAPGDPTSRYFDPNVSPEVIEQMRRNLGLDQPVPVQYLKWMGSGARWGAVSKQLGFASQSGLSHFVKALTGLSPREVETEGMDFWQACALRGIR